MSKFQQFWWYVAVGVTAIALVLSVVSRNWILTITCAVSTYFLRKTNDKVAIPKVYADRGINNDIFTPGRKKDNEKNNK